MSVLEGLEPASVFHFFEEICKIPHGSGNEEQLSDYLKRFAMERDLLCIQDAAKNSSARIRGGRDAYHTGAYGYGCRKG